MTGVGVKRLGTWERKILRRVYGPVVEQGMWKIRTNQELRELCKNLDIITDIEKKRLECAGHVLRNHQGRAVKKIFESKPDGSRRGRPRLRLLKDVEKDLQELKFKRWRHKEGSR
jgi:hypothetical protein